VLATARVRKGAGPLPDDAALAAAPAAVVDPVGRKGPTGD
jgi:hypothetical protein